MQRDFSEKRNEHLECYDVKLHIKLFKLKEYSTHKKCIMAVIYDSEDHKKQLCVGIRK